MLEFFSQAALLDGEEPESEHAQREMMLPANPGADLVVIEADFALGELEDLLDVVAVGHSAEQRFSVNGRIFGREEVLRLGTVEALNDQQDVIVHAAAANCGAVPAAAGSNAGTGTPWS